MAKFTDKKGDVWNVHITLDKTRRIANVVGIDVFNFEDYDKLSASIGVRLEYLYHVCREQCADYGVADLDEFASRLMSKESTANEASDALQTALVAFFRRLGQTTMADLAEEHLKYMQEARQALTTSEAREQLKKASKVGRASLRSQLLRDSTPGS